MIASLEHARREPGEDAGGEGARRGEPLRDRWGDVSVIVAPETRARDVSRTAGFAAMSKVWPKFSEFCRASAQAGALASGEPSAMRGPKVAAVLAALRAGGREELGR